MTSHAADFGVNSSKPEVEAAVIEAPEARKPSAHKREVPGERGRVTVVLAVADIAASHACWVNR
ncbi:MAG: hypothetical protein ACJA0P_000416 [Planctomycetota bacterium]|jgi:hypothetical protein